MEPLDVDIRRIEIDVLDLGIRLDPVDPFALFGPEALRVLNGSLVHFQVLIVGAPRLFGDGLGDRINVLF
jgi:hypothetical protein